MKKYISVLLKIDEMLGAKENKIKNWIDNDIFDEVENHGDNAISIKIGGTRKRKDGEVVTKASLYKGLWGRYKQYLKRFSNLFQEKKFV